MRVNHAPQSPVLYAALLAALVFAAVAPTLLWLEFSSGPENLVVETVLEMNRSGEALVPTLMGVPRTQKPPLAAWATAAGAGQSSLDRIGSEDPDERAAGYFALRWEVRWTALLAACVGLLLVYDLGHTLGGPRLGWTALAVCASTPLFLRYCRSATTDVWLMLWVLAANAALARALFDPRRVVGWCAAAGIAAGLAVMTKGPVALVQTALPVLAYIAWRAWRGGRVTKTLHLGGIEPVAPPAAVEAGLAAGLPVPLVAGRPRFVDPGEVPPTRRIAAAVLVGTALMLVVAVPWFAYVLSREPGVWRTWASEVTREGARGRGYGNPLAYLIGVPLMGPWVVFFVAGLVLAGIDLWRRPWRRAGLAAVLAVGPVLVMSLFRDRPDRYLLPMVGPAAVVAAIGLRAHLRAWRRWRWPRADRTVASLHFGLLLVAAIGLPVAGATVLRTPGGAAWYPAATALILAACLAAMSGLAVWLYRHWPGGLVMGTTMLTLGLAAAFIWGYRSSRQGRAELRPLAEAVRSAYPTARLVYVESAGQRAPPDLAIYADRIVRNVANPAAVPGDGRPVVWVVRQEPGEPTPEPPGWRLVASAPRDAQTWWAFVRE